MSKNHLSFLLSEVWEDCRLEWQFVMGCLGGKVMVTPDLAMLYCYTSANGWQYMTIYDIHDSFMVIYVMYYTKYKQHHHHHPYSRIIHRDGLYKLKSSNRYIILFWIWYNLMEMLKQREGEDISQYYHPNALTDWVNSQRKR